MALIKIYTEQQNFEELRTHVARTIKLVGAAALNVPEVPTSPSSVETVLAEGLDLIGIDYICEIIAVERSNEQDIANSFVEGLNAIYPEKLFSAYFVHIEMNGMANTPRNSRKIPPLSMEEAILQAKELNV